MIVTISIIFVADLGGTRPGPPISIFSSPMGAYAIPLASSVVRRVSPVSTITTRNNEAIKSIFSVNVYHVPGLYLLGNGGAPTSVIILWLETIFLQF